MHARLKNITALALVLLFAIPLLFSVWLTLEQTVGYSNRANSSEAITQTILLSATNIQWIKKDKEVIINGKYFDVKSFTTDGNWVALTGHFDHQEDKIVSRIKNIFQQQNKSENPFNQSTLKYIFLPVYSSQTDVAATARYCLSKTKFYSYSEETIEAPCSIFSPPPELPL